MNFIFEDLCEQCAVTDLPCLEGGGVLGGDLSDGEGQAGGSQEEAKSPELLEVEEVSCTLVHQVLGTYNLKRKKLSETSAETHQ